MKLTRITTDRFRAGALALMLGVFGVGTVQADALSDFEAMLQEAIQRTPPAVESEKSPEKKNSKTEIPAKETEKKDVKATGNAPKKKNAKPPKESPTAFKVSGNGKTEPQSVDAGWSVVVPHENAEAAPVVGKKVAEKTETKIIEDMQASPLETAPGGDVFALVVTGDQAPEVPADQSGNEPVVASVWDAVPVSVSAEGEETEEDEVVKLAMDPAVSCPWDTVSDIETDTESEEQTVEDSWEKRENPGQDEETTKPEKDKQPKKSKSEDQAKKTDSKNSIKDSTEQTDASDASSPENDNQDVKPARKKSTPKKVPAKKDVDKPVEDDTVKPTKDSESPTEGREDEKKTDEKTVETVAKDDENTVEEKASGESVQDDMTAKLRDIEKKNREEAAQKENDDPGVATTLTVHEETVEPKKIVVRDDEKSKDAENLKENGKKTEEIAEDSGKKETPPEMIVRELPEAAVPDFDDSDAEEVVSQKWIDASRVGDPHAKAKIKLMYDEITNALKGRNMAGKYEMWKSYAKSTLRGTDSLSSGSEVDNRCRLSWYAKMYSEPIFSVFDVEEFSRKMHHGLNGSHRHIAETMGMIREKLDVPARNDDGIRFQRCETPFDAINEVKRCLLEAQMAHGRAMSTLSTVEQNELADNLVSTFSGQGCTNGHTIPNRTYGRKLCNIMNKMDKTGIHDAAEALIPLTNKALLGLLKDIPNNAFPTIMLNGQKVQRIATAAGDIIIGGPESNVYDLDSPAMRDVVCVIDQGGDDIFREGSCNLQRPVLVVITLAGNDTFTGSKPGIQGGSVLGVSMLISLEGENTYTAGDVAQGSTLGGAGMLFDFGGAGNYKGMRRVQGHALCGVGILVSRGGNDKFRAALWAQGFGAPGGFGVLNNAEGNNHYYCGGMWLDSYPEHPGYDGWGQGIGAGIRQVANGGIGMILSGTGNDVYEVDYFGHGGGYWLGLGVARDFGGNDVRYGTTKTAYNGGPRREQEWTRFMNGFGCHYALGFLFDDAGNDEYGGRIMGTGMAWDLSIGYLCDFNGNDRFTATGGMTQGVGAEGSIGILFSYGGNDNYAGRNQGYASGGISYHSPSNCGSNFSFLVNHGGNDTYGCGAKNNAMAQRGSPGGFLIDRPTESEAAEQIAAFNKMVEDREKEIAEFNEAQEKLKAEVEAKGRRYYPPRRRPMPITPDQNKMIGAVPDFNSIPARTGGNEVKVK